MKKTTISKVINRIYQAARVSRDERGTANLEAKDIAKIVRIKLREKFPNVKFSVTSRYSSMRVSWSAGPTTKEVDEIIRHYSFGGFDGSIDMDYSIRNWLLPNGDMEHAATQGTEGSRGSVPSDATDCPSPGAVLVSSGMKYTSTSREISEAAWEVAVRATLKEFGQEWNESLSVYRQHLDSRCDYVVSYLHREPEQLEKAILQCGGN